MADNPVSWFFLMVIGIYFVCRFLRQAFFEYEERREERERYVDQLFLENSIDKSNIKAYNRYIHKGGRNQ